MNFSRDKFTTQLGNTGVSFPYGSTWKTYNGSIGEPLNTQLTYHKNNIEYRTWSPETSTLPTDLGLVVSCKIDFENGMGDDHIILIVGFLKVKGAAPTINFIQASVQFYNDDDKNIMIDPIKSDPNNPINNLGQELYNRLNDLISADHFAADENNQTAQGRNSLPGIAQANVNSMIGAVSA